MKRATVVKVPAKLTAEIDGFVRDIRKFSGVEVSREQAAHALLRRGLRSVREQTVVDPLQMLAMAARETERKK